MTINLKELFDKHDAEYGKFKEPRPVPVKIINSLRPDLNAFILLDKLIPGDTDIIACAEHDQFWLSTDPAVLAEVATEDDIITLIRCGVMFDEELGLSMFV